MSAFDDDMDALLAMLDAPADDGPALPRLVAPRPAAPRPRAVVPVPPRHARPSRRRAWVRLLLLVALAGVLLGLALVVSIALSGAALAVDAGAPPRGDVDVLVGGLLVAGGLVWAAVAAVGRLRRVLRGDSP